MSEECLREVSWREEGQFIEMTVGKTCFDEVSVFDEQVVENNCTDHRLHKVTLN